MTALLPAEALALSVAKAQLARGENPPPNTTAMLALTIDRLTGAMCSDLHGRNCEPPSELCCENCTEWDHPRHEPGMVCASPDLSDLRAQAGERA